LSEDRTGYFSRAESPRARQGLIDDLKKYRDEQLLPDLKQLKKFTQGRRIKVQSAQDSDDFFLDNVITIALGIFDRVGGESGPLTEFVSVAAEKVLRNPPEPENLRSRARRLAARL
jgi:hypothetical protein